MKWRYYCCGFIGMFIGVSFMAFLKLSTSDSVDSLLDPSEIASTFKGISRRVVDLTSIQEP